MTTTTRRTRTSGLLPAAVFLTALLTTVASGQWLETHIPIPDSMNSVSQPFRVILDSADNEMYVSGEYDTALLVLDGTTGTKLRQVLLPGFWFRLIGDSPLSRVAYCAAGIVGTDANTVLVVDLENDSLLAEIGGFYGAFNLCLVPELNKVYITNVGPFVTVLDGATHQVIDTIGLTSGESEITYNPTAGKVYCLGAWDSVLAVIDPVYDSLLGCVTTGPLSRSLCNSPAENKVYVSYDDPAAIAVVDCATDSVVARILGATDDVFTAMFYNPANNHLYCCGYADTVAVIDCAGDSLLKRISARSPDPDNHFEGWGFCWAPEHDRLYCYPPDNRNQTTLLVIDCAADTLVGQLTVGRRPADLVYSPRSGRLFAPCWSGASVAVVDCASDSVELVVFTCSQPAQLAYCTRENKVYVAGDLPEAVFAIDAATNEVVATIPMLHTNSWEAGRMNDLCYVPETNAIYASCAEDRSVTVIDCAADSIVTRLHFFRKPMYLCYCPDFGSRVYCGSIDELYVIDCRTNTVIDVITLPGSHLYRMAYASGSAKLYCEVAWSGGPDFIAVDCSTGTPGREFRTGSSMSLTYNPVGNKVYLACPQPVVVDCATDSVLGAVPSSEGWWYTTGYNDLENKVYFAEPTDYPDPYLLLIVDGETDSVLAEIENPGGGQDLRDICYNRMNNKVYVSCENSARVAIIDGATDIVIDSIRVGSMPREMVWNPIQNRVYVANFRTADVSVITDSLIPGVAEGQGSAVRAKKRLPTILRGPELARLDCRVIDALGRDVTDRRERLAPGVYFLRSTTDLHRPASDVSKVLVLR